MINYSPIVACRKLFDNWHIEYSQGNLNNVMKKVNTKYKIAGTGAKIGLHSKIAPARTA
jgi:hypothetical protein